MKGLKYLLVSLALLSVLIPVFAAAETDSGGQEQVSAREYADRAKESYPLNLSEREQTRISSRCRIAQSRLETILENLNSKIPNLTVKFALIDKNLVAFERRLQRQDIDASELDLFIASLRKLVSDYEDKLTDYRLSLTYVSEAECEDDPLAFRSLLEDARTKRRDFASALGAITSLVQNDLHDTLATLKDKVDSESEQ